MKGKVRFDLVAHTSVVVTVDVDDTGLPVDEDAAEQLAIQNAQKWAIPWEVEDEGVTPEKE